MAMKIPRGAVALAAVFFVAAATPLVSRLLADEPPPPPPVEDIATSDPEPVPTATQTSPPRVTGLPKLEGPAPRARRYPSLEVMAAHLKKRGLECTSLEYLEQPDPTLKEFALCDMGTPKRRVDLWLYASKRDRNGWLAGMRGSGVTVVYGANWIVTVGGDPETSEARGELVQLAIGGDILGD